jgi:hypothetical protein
MIPVLVAVLIMVVGDFIYRLPNQVKLWRNYLRHTNIFIILGEEFQVFLVISY